jgi:hypothetical protein
MRIPVVFHKSEKFGTLIGEPILLHRFPFATSREYEEVIPRVKKAYQNLINEVKNNGDLGEALDKFLRETSAFAILDASFKECLAKELGMDESWIDKVLLSTRYIEERLKSIRCNFRKKRKADPLGYAEEIGEIVSLFGFEKTLELFRSNKLRMGKSTLQGLYKVSMMPTWLKAKVGTDIPLTIAFELPENVDEEAINAISGLKYHEAKEALRNLRRLRAS